jgi:hypothetical protein
MTKAELQKHGEKLANEHKWKYQSMVQLPDINLPSIVDVEKQFELGFNQALELLFPLVDALKNSAAPWDLNEKTKVIEVLTECSIRENGCKKALAELEKKVRGE